MKSGWNPNIKRAMAGIFFILSVIVHGVCAPPEGILLEERFESTEAPAYKLEGDATVFDFGKSERDSAGKSARLDSAKDVNGDGKHAGEVKFTVHGLANSEGKWFRFSFRGLPGEGFRVRQDDDLVMRVSFYNKSGAPLDGVVKEIYRDIEKDRRDIGVNGDGFRAGAVAWPLYAFDFRLPFNDIETIELSVRFEDGEGKEPYGSFFVDDVKVESIDAPLAAPAKKGQETSPGKADLIPIAGKWYYLPKKGEGVSTTPRHFDSRNLDQLVYKSGDVSEVPFAECRGAWLRKGFKDTEGQVVQSDKWLDNVVEVDFQKDTMVIHSRDIPNHPTGVFPGYLGNPNYIQEQEVVAYLPLNPQPNPAAIAMSYKNGNRALPMGPTGIAVNGVVFYNPFDAGMEEAVGIMDRCCGHPNFDNEYHYHKYPVCARSPFEDTGEEHSHLIGWAFDGFPIYGPYEGRDEMAMNSKLNPLNAFNMHYDKDRGWHYHVTPGKFPYIIGGYWGKSEPRNFHPPRHPRGGGMGPQRPPPM